jgi:hypothetical protein
MQDSDWDPKVLDLEQSENLEWYSNADDPPLLNPDFDVRGDYRHCIAYKVDHHDDDRTTSKAFNPTGRILVHDHDVYFDSFEELSPILTLRSQLTTASSELTCIIMFTTLTLTLTLPWLHNRSITGLDRSRMTHETMRLFILVLHGLIVTLFGKRWRLQPSLPGCL